MKEFRTLIRACSGIGQPNSRRNPLRVQSLGIDLEDEHTGRSPPGSDMQFAVGRAADVGPVEPSGVATLEPNSGEVSQTGRRQTNNPRPVLAEHSLGDHGRSL